MELQQYKKTSKASCWGAERQRLCHVCRDYRCLWQPGESRCHRWGIPCSIMCACNRCSCYAEADISLALHCITINHPGLQHELTLTFPGFAGSAGPTGVQGIQGTSGKCSILTYYALFPSSNALALLLVHARFVPACPYSFA